MKIEIDSNECSDFENNEIENDQPRNKKMKFDEHENGTVLGEKYHPPPDFKFPTKQLGKGNFKKNRKCMHSWFTKWNFLHYDINKNSLFCYPCSKVYQQKLLPPDMLKKLERTFICGEGFSQWKKASERIPKHQSSDGHLKSIALFSKTSDFEDIGTVISSEYQQSVKENRECLLIIIDNIRYLLRQGLPLRGNTENESNFNQLLEKDKRKNPKFAEWLRKKSGKYTSHAIQDEIIEIIAMKILRKVVKKIKDADFYSIMADETADVANIEQLTFVIRIVTEKFEIKEYFIGLHELENTKSDHLVTVIKNILLACDFDFNKIRGQCYDKASSMSGKKSGVKTQILTENKKALWIHCYNHALNLAVMDALSEIRLFRDSLSFCEEILVLVEKSPKRENLLKNIKKEEFDDSPGLKSFSRTRWTVKGKSLNSLITNWKPVFELFKRSYKEETKTDMKSRLNGAMYQMKKFNFLFAICLAKEILIITDNLAKSLQERNLSASQGKELYKITAKTLETMKTEGFEKFWQDTLKLSEKLAIECPELKRKRKKPAKFLDSSDEDEERFPNSPKEHFQNIFFEIFGLSIGCLKDRFEQEDLEHYTNLQDLLMLAAENLDYDEKLEQVLEFYKDDFDEDNLRAQLQSFKSMFKKKDNLVFGDIIDYFKKLEPQILSLLSEVCKIVKLILVLPASNAESERSFSKMKLVKDRLRSTMNAKKLNHFMIVAHNKDIFDNLDFEEIADEFISRTDRRQKILGK